MTTTSWLLLLYSLPARQASARLSLWRHLKRIGAVALKTSAYILPQGVGHEESLQWLAQKIRQDGGDATLLRAAQVDTLSDQDVIELFQSARTEDYQAILADLRALQPLKGKKAAPEVGDLERLSTRYQAVRRIDFFDCPLAREVHEALAALTPSPLAGAPLGRKVRARDYQGRQWQTRPRPELDRVASAWLIRRFIDPEATFVFSPEQGAFPGAVTYDMVGADFGHEGDNCTFETLVRRFGLREPGLEEIAAIVHAADVEDGKFSQTEGNGLLAVLRGWGKLGVPDDEILRRGAELMEGLIKAQLMIKN